MERAAQASLIVTLLTVAHLVLGASSAVAQDSSLRLRLVSPPVLPNTAAFVNAILSNPTGEAVSEVRQRLEFSRDALRFVRARLGIAGESARAVLSVLMQDASGAAVAEAQQAERLEVAVTAKQQLPGGPLVEFEFRPVASTDEQSIRVGHTAEARDGQGKPLPDLAFADVHVTVTKDIGMQPLKVFSCFFYMH